MARFTISGTGCSLGDFVFPKIGFSLASFKKFLSHKDGDGGLTPGKLVFTEEFERYSGQPYAEAIKTISGNQEAEKFNLGGPGIVALINTAQLLHNYDVKINFHAAVGKDDIGNKILSIVEKTPIDKSHFHFFDNRSPFTDVLSDPDYDNGKGERIFINNIGCAGDLTPEHLGDDFFKSDMVVFGGTALVPQIHDNITALLKKAKAAHCITVVNTVYDFRNEKKNPQQKWPLGESDESYQHTDLLIMSIEEALRMSGERDVHKAAAFFISKKTGAVIITQGAGKIIGWSSGALFQLCDIFEMPVSSLVGKELTENPSLKGDTTGCGDNFAGGVIASLAMQILGNSKTKPSLQEAIALGVASGGFACYYVGGTYLEKEKGEKARCIDRLYKDYINEKK